MADGNGTSLSGKVAIVTGATSGIGAATCVELSRRGASVVLVGRDQAKGESVLRDLAITADRTWLVCGNVAQSAFCDAVVSGTVARFGKLDILVNAAGVNNRGIASQTTDAMWQETMDINVGGTFFMCRSAISVMRLSRSGAIVNVASDWGLVGGKGHVAYCASKGAVVNMTRALALDHACEGIRINVVCPGEVRTPMLASGLARRGFDPAVGFEQLGATIPIGRISEPVEQARCIAFLASSEASYMTGAVVSVDGGATAA